MSPIYLYDSTNKLRGKLVASARASNKGSRQRERARSRHEPQLRQLHPSPVLEGVVCSAPIVFAARMRVRLGVCGATAAHLHKKRCSHRCGPRRKHSLLAVPVFCYQMARQGNGSERQETESLCCLRADLRSSKALERGPSATPLTTLLSGFRKKRRAQSRMNACAVLGAHDEPAQ